MEITILGWGSLIWDTEKGKEFDRHRRGGWKRAEGLTLPLEFSRISRSRKGSLTLVIDGRHGTECPVQYTTSKRDSLEDVIRDLRCREGTIHRNIGYWSETGRSQRHQYRDRISGWARERGFDAVVWTALESNFLEITGEGFSVESACRYLKNLPSGGRREARKYIENAPSEISTGLRDGIKACRPFGAGG